MERTGTWRSCRKPKPHWDGRDPCRRESSPANQVALLGLCAGEGSGRPCMRPIFILTGAAKWHDGYDRDDELFVGSALVFGAVGSVWYARRCDGGNGREVGVSELHRITVNPEQSGGRPSIRGLRVRVKDVLELLAAGVSREEILTDYPYLEDGDITAALEYAAQQSDHPVLRAH
jgi:uncharacterized protein (DUF433 family)